MSTAEPRQNSPGAGGTGAAGRAHTAPTIALDLEHVRSLIAGGRNHALAHSWIDELYVQVLRAIADGAEDPASLASEALAAEEIEFQRKFDS